jgi:transposase
MRRRFTDEFKADAVRLARQPGMTVAQTARDLGIADSLLRSWIKAAEHPAGNALREDERQELARLRREVRNLRMEQEILKKATAFFARGSR